MIPFFFSYLNHEPSSLPSHTLQNTASNAPHGTFSSLRPFLPFLNYTLGTFSSVHVPVKSPPLHPRRLPFARPVFSSATLVRGFLSPKKPPERSVVVSTRCSEDMIHRDPGSLFTPPHHHRPRPQLCVNLTHLLRADFQFLSRFPRGRVPSIRIFRIPPSFGPL